MRQRGILTLRNVSKYITFFYDSRFEDLYRGSEDDLRWKRRNKAIRPVQILISLWSCLPKKSIAANKLTIKVLNYFAIP